MYIHVEIWTDSCIHFTRIYVRTHIPINLYLHYIYVSFFIYGCLCVCGYVCSYVCASIFICITYPFLYKSLTEGNAQNILPSLGRNLFPY